jgi:hypothetical protein
VLTKGYSSLEIVVSELELNSVKPPPDKIEEEKKESERKESEDSLICIR